MARCPCFSVVLEATHEVSRGPIMIGAVDSSKSPSRFRDVDGGVAGRKGREKHTLDEGS